MDKVTLKALVKDARAFLRREAKQQAYARTVVTQQDINFYHGSPVCLFGQVEPDSLDLIVTDPAPMGCADYTLYAEIAQFASYALKEDASLMCTSCKCHFPQVLKKICQYIPYRWTCCYMDGNDEWKPLITCWAGKRIKGRWIQDVFRNRPFETDRVQPFWGKHEGTVASIIEATTTPGDAICDPCAGQGATALAALRLRRRFIGCDSNFANVEYANRRIQAAASLIETSGDQWRYYCTDASK